MPAQNEHIHQVDERLKVVEKILIVGNGSKPYLSLIPTIEERILNVEKILEHRTPALDSIPIIKSELDHIRKGIDRLPEIHESLGEIKAFMGSRRQKQKDVSTFLIGLILAIVTVVGTAVLAM